MKSLWNDKEASEYKTELGLRVYTSRLLGRDKTLVLHGGGNTSVKITEKNIYGQDEEILYIKGSGWDLETIEEAGFSPVRQKNALALSELEKLSDPQMVNELKTSMTNAGSPAPSVETILHAIIPFKYVDHTHADALVSVTNTPDGEKYIKEIYGDKVIVIPYLMPGFDLARYCAVEFKKNFNDKIIGMVLLKHGMFSFGNNAKESYERMIELIDMAEKFLEKKSALNIEYKQVNVTEGFPVAAISELRKKVSAFAGSPFILHTALNDKTMTFSNDPEIDKISQQGPATPDHIIRTKRLPLNASNVDRNVEKYAESYKKYFETNAPKARDKKSILDSAPRVIVDSQCGIITAGKSIKDAMIVSEIYDHTIDIIYRAEKLGGYRALNEFDLFEMEYWDLEQAKLKKSGSSPMFQGEIVLITGAASGIGKACAEEFLKNGACVIGIDLNPEIKNVSRKSEYLGIQCDITDQKSLESAIEQGVKNFGGIDMVVLNAGIFPKSMPVAAMDMETWNKVMQINLSANVLLLKLCHPVLKNAPKYGRVVIIGSKNVAAPGPGASAYSASKAALNQLARVIAFEWGSDGIRINSIHPNAVFDTGIWTEEVLQSRAKSYGLSVEEYKKNNVLKTEVTSADVARLTVDMCGPNFSKTTAAYVPVDGGNDRVI
jgi:rhamnose utilization protein RhaD (predicted bifunctional aldolase and dehydrogenase)/NAD(P)-dependent dehydrogenase (short-subunit alcohol dehydrogenase family)